MDDGLGEDFGGWFTGVVRYADGLRPGDRDARIVIPVRFAGLLTEAIVDTGAPWCILGAELAEAAGALLAEGDVRTLMVRGSYVRGRLARVALEFVATAGESLTIDASVFVPLPGEALELPNFVGLLGALERIRFGVDGRRNLFAFGAAHDAPSITRRAEAPRAARARA